MLLLDEPLGALDLKMRQEMQIELKEMHKTLGITFIYVTHDQEEALTMSDTVVVMKDGVICQEGTPIDIYNEPLTAYVADFIGESNILDGIMIDDYKVNIVGTEFACVDAGFGQNKPVDIVIRPEDIEVKPKEKGIITGVIKSSMFRGVHYEMMCECNGFEFIIHSTIEAPIGKEVGLYVALKGSSAKIRFGFADVDMTDDEYAAPLAGNVDSMIYKGKNYIVDIKTDDNHHIYADTEYLWDKGDRVGIKIDPDKFEIVKEEAADIKTDGDGISAKNEDVKGDENV